MEQLTIYTATYNRSKTLPRVYHSLSKQTNKDFRWLIIDDGSTDGTKAIVDKWLEEDQEFHIDYILKDNGGIHTVRDYAYSHCKTELIFSIDSDDWVAEDTVQKILELWNKSDTKKYAGIFVATRYLNEEKIDNGFPSCVSVSYQDLTYKYHYKGDKMTVLRADVIKKIPMSPIFESEKLVAEGYKWIQLPDNLPFLLLNEPLLIKEYQEDGYTKNVHKMRFRNLNGRRANARQHIISAKYFRVRLQNHIKYIIYSLWLKDKNFIKNSPKPVQTALLAPIGFFIFLIMDKKWGKYKS